MNLLVWTFCRLDLFIKYLINKNESLIGVDIKKVYDPQLKVWTKGQS